MIELTKTFALISGSIDEHFAADNISERQKHLHELSVTKLLWQVVDKKIAALWA